MEFKNFAIKIHRLTRLMTALSEHRWGSDGFSDIKMAHLQALIPLSLSNHSSIELANAAGVTKQSMNRVINDLIRFGYVEIAKVGSSDARIKMLCLSTKGRSFIKYLTTTRYDLERKIAEIMTPQKFIMFNNLLDTLLDFVEERHQDLIEY